MCPAHSAVMSRPGLYLVEGKAAREWLAIALLMPGLDGSLLTPSTPMGTEPMEAPLPPPPFYISSQMKGSVKEPNIFRKYETRKSLVSQWCSRIYRVVWFFRPRSSCTTHLLLFCECLPIYASSCMTILDGRTEQLYIIAGFCRVAGFTSDFCLPKTSSNICVLHDDLGWKNRTTRCNRFCGILEYVDICSVY